MTLGLDKTFAVTRVIGDGVRYAAAIPVLGGAQPASPPEGDPQ